MKLEINTSNSQMDLLWIGQGEKAFLPKKKIDAFHKMFKKEFTDIGIFIPTKNILSIEEEYDICLSFFNFSNNKTLTKNICRNIKSVNGKTIRECIQMIEEKLYIISLIKNS